MDSKQLGDPDPARFFSVATGWGDLTGIASVSIPGRPTPLLLTGQAQRGLRKAASTTSKIYISELYAAISSIFQL